MPTTKSRSRTVSTDSRGSHTVSRAESGLSMECSDEDLSPAQLNFYNKQKMAYNETMSKLENLTRAGATVATNPDGSVTFTLTESSSNLGPVTQKPVIPGAGAQYRLLVDQRTGKVVGSVGNTAAPATPAVSTAPAQIRLQSPASRGRGGGVRMPGRGGMTSITQGRRGQSPAPVSSMTPGKSPQVVDLTSYQTTDHPGRGGNLKNTFPALSVTAKPQKTVAPAQSKRSELDGRVKKLLVDGPAKFTEWLISQGLVKTEQYEEVMGVQKKLKLGMHSDSKKFPHSGGYVWILEGQSKYTSVFSGSLFDPASEASAPTPTMCLKLLYHWSCQTNIPNVANWVKVQNKKINDFYAMMRAVCVAAVQDEVTGLGGGGVRHAVEVGVISLGTTTADGQRREVRVEVLGVLDRVTKQIRLRATEPIPGASQQERFTKIFEMLPTWVHPSTQIMTDFSVDKDILYKMGFKSVQLCSLNSDRAAQSSGNWAIMDYLKKVVPKMYQNTLSSLSTEVIQQFLDELTFRELFGHYPLACFDAIIQRISTQTAMCATKPRLMGDSVTEFLTKVAQNPFKDWRYSDRHSDIRVPITPSPRGASPAIYKSPSPASNKRAGSEESDETFMKRMKASGKEMIPLESFYYATLPGDTGVQATEFKADMAFKCPITRKTFMNNIQFMKFLHLQVDTQRETAIDIADLSQCNYCYKDFDSESKVQTHQDTECVYAYKRGAQYVDRITNTVFSSQGQLIQHMMKNHVKYEMPYSCQVCGYRSSFHHDVIEHFQLQHDRTDKLLCPKSLRVFSLYTSQGYNPAVATAYLQHLQKMEDLKGKSSLKCKKSVLRFSEEKHLRAHLADDFSSYKEFDDVEPFQLMASDEPVMIPRPEEKTMRPAIRNLANFMPLQSSFAAQNLEDLAIYDASSDRCCECGRSMTSGGHYAAYLCCTKCRYSTCCSKSMGAHHQLFHSGKKEFNLGKSSILSEPMFCVCGFSAHSGNKMAKHLGTHGCKSAYPSQEEADKAKVEKVEKGEKRKDRQEEADSSSQREEDSDRQKDEDGTDVEKVGNDDEQDNNDKEDKSKKDEATTEDEESGEVGKEKEASESQSEASIEKMIEEDVEESKTESPDTDANEKEAEAEKPPGPGGLLFGTFFNYMGADQSSGDQANNEKKSEDVVSEEEAKKCEEDEKETNDDKMETE